MAKKEKVRKPHGILHSIGLFLSCLLLIIGIVLNGVMLSMGSMIDAFIAAPKSDASPEQIQLALEEGKTLAAEIQAESTVLLQNLNNVLPLSADINQINVFGWASTQWLGGGSGSGGVNAVNTNLLSALENYGIRYNTDLVHMYQDFQPNREYTATLSSYPEQSCQLYEPSIEDTAYYTEQMLADAKAYSNTALVVLGRISGESNDCTQIQYKRTVKGGEIVVDESRTYLDLSAEEEALLTYVGENYENVIVLVNSGNVMALGAIETTPGIDACLMVGMTGMDAASAIPAMLWGEVEPSGRTADTWAYDFATAASYANAGAQSVGAYTNADGLYPANGTNNGNLGSPLLYSQVSYADYVEGIYIGYKWYETADAEGYWDDVSNVYGTGYDGVVQYPFGFGLSYTSFDWEIMKMPTELDKDGTVEVQVKVKNTGNRAGKDVVQLYYTAPYIPGEIEKSSVELAAFGKTQLLQPGEEQTLTLTFDVRDMASYDYNDANGNSFKGYELDAGEYTISVRHDSHTVEEAVTLTLEESEQYPTDAYTGAEVSNKFTGEDAMDGISLDGTDSEQNIVYMTRADFVGTFPKANVNSRPMTENVAALNLYTPEMAQQWIDENDEPIITGAKNGLLVEKDGVITELGKQLGADFNDPQWDAVLDQMTKEEMIELNIHGYAKMSAVDSIGKEHSKDADGPAQIGSFTGGANSGTGFSSASTLAQSWNTELAREEGRMIGRQAGLFGYSGWYAPAVNMHRSPFNGRNYEYYSEDSYLSGQMCGNTVAGSMESGTFCYVKHFICNDQESGIYRDSIYLWMTEQTLRQTYLEPFRIIVEEYGATGLMSAYNRIGAVWAGGSKALLTGITQDEWGFHGAIVTDYSDHHQFMNGDQMIRAGGTMWMDGMFAGTLTCETESNSFWQAMRAAAKRNIYTYLNARVCNLEYVEETGDTEALRPTIKAPFPMWRVLVVVIGLLGVFCVVMSIRALVRDHKLRKAAKIAKTTAKEENN